MKKINTTVGIIISLTLFAVFLIGCATNTQPTQTALETRQTQAATRLYTGPRSDIILGDFNNRSGFMQGIFNDNDDRLGNQARTILLVHLQQTNRFTVLDRNHLEQASREAELRGETQNLIGASFILAGEVTEFGRRQVSNMQLFGILGSGTSQVAYAVVSIYVIDIRTNALVYSVQGAGEVALNDRQILGFGTAAGYDSTLNGQVLDLAIREAVDRLADGIDRGLWRP